LTDEKKVGGIRLERPSFRKLKLGTNSESIFYS
jgi:hypothetical protein